MPVFEYQAIAKSGKSVKGIVDADSPAVARRKLREQQLYPTKVKETTAQASDENNAQLGFSRVSVRDMALLTRQMAVLLQAGMPVVDTMAALIDQTSKQRLRNAIYEIRENVREGMRLGDAMAHHPKLFNLLYVNMVRAGESSGSLEQVLFRLADVMEHQAKLRAKIASVMAYPLFMALFAVGIITFLMTVIIPKIIGIFQKQEQQLPRITEVMIGMTHFIGTYWYFLAGIFIGGFFLLRVWLSRESGRLAWDKFVLQIPLLGGLQVKLICARYARTLGTMLESGLTMMKALDVVTTVIQNKYVEEKMADIKAGVRRGRDLAVPMKESGFFPTMLIHMVELGQRSGELETMLSKVAETYDEDVRLTLEALVALLEPIIIVVMGIFVGFIVLATLLPILNMSSGI